MKNEEIILRERIFLLHNKKIESTGKYINISTAEGREIRILEPEEIHTETGWRKEKRKIKKGEEPITEIKIWKGYSKNNKGGLIQTKAKFYKISQTEEIKNE